MKKCSFFIFFVIFTLILVGCNQSLGKNEENRIGIRGEIKQIAWNDDKEISHLYVEGIKEEDTDYDKANIKITDKTKFIQKGSNHELSETKLQQGMKIEVIFEGAVAESYPVQGTAKEVRIVVE